MFLPTRVVLTACVASTLALAQTRVISDEEVQKVHRSALLIDTHNDVTGRTVDGFDIGPLAKDGDTDLVRLKQGGQGAIFLSVYVGADTLATKSSAHRAMQMIDTSRHDIIERYPKDFAYADSVASILEARKSGRIAALMGIEGGYAIEDDLRLLRNYYALGVRYMTLTHMKHTSWATSANDAPRMVDGKPQGLTEFGKQVVAEMNRLGMLVDISHVSDATFYDALETSKAPIFASHSSCRALDNVARNMTDDMIVALAKKGGVVQVNFACSYLSQASADSSAFTNPKLMERLMEATKDIAEPKAKFEAAKKLMTEWGIKPVPATIDDVVAHIDHIKKIAGIQAVGLGSDFDGVDCLPVGLENVSKWPNLTRKLLERGYTADEIRLIYGGNFLRVFGAVERTAAQLRTAR